MVIDPTYNLADLDFQGKHADEEFQFYFRQHWIRLVWPFSKLIIRNLLIFFIGYVMFTQVLDDAGVRRATLIVLSLLFLMFHLEFLIRFYRYFLYIIIVTDKKIHRIKKTLLAVDDHQSVDMWMLQDLNKSQHGVVQNMFGFGSLILEAQDTEVRLHFVPNIREKYQILMHLREKARSRMNYLDAVLQRQEPVTV